MVFQKPNPFPKSIYENVAYGPRIHGLCRNKGELNDRVEQALKRAGLWAEVSDRLREPGLGELHHHFKERARRRRVVVGEARHQVSDELVLLQVSGDGPRALVADQMAEEVAHLAPPVLAAELGRFSQESADLPRLRIDVVGAELWASAARQAPRKLLHGVSASFPAASLTAVMGPPHSGKKEVLQMLSMQAERPGAVHPRPIWRSRLRVAGELRVNGLDVYGDGVHTHTQARGGSEST